MQMGTLFKLGGLAFDVAQDEKVKELVTIIHKGGKRRGMWGVQPTANGSQAGAGSNDEAHPIPFAPKSETEKKPQKPASKPGLYLPPQQGLPGGGVSKYLNAGNAMKMKKWAAEIGQFLIQK